MGNVLKAYKITFENKTDYPVSCSVKFTSVGDFIRTGDLADCDIPQRVKLDPKAKGTVGSKDIRCLISFVRIRVNTGRLIIEGRRLIVEKNYETGPGKTMKRVGNQTIVIEPAPPPKHVKIRRK